MWMRLVCPGTVHFLFLHVSAEGWDDAKHLLKYRSYSFDLWVCMFIDNRAMFRAIAGTTFIEMQLPFLNPSFCFFGDLLQTAAIRIGNSFT